jgi:predicted nucleotidyltransferase
MQNPAEVPFQARRSATIEKAVAILSADPRFAAGWLEGSLADGSADPYSDIDLYLCVDDDAFQNAWDDRRVIIERIAPIAASLDIRGLFGIGCLLAGPVKLDVFFEKRSAIGARTRPAVKRLWGPEAIFAQLKVGDVPGDAAIRFALETLVLGFLQGGTWPVRMLARGQINTFLFNEILLIETGIIPLMLLEGDRRAFNRNMFTRAKLLTPEQSAECARLTDRITIAVRSGDREGMRDTHVEIFRRICELARAAFDRFGMEFPPHAEPELVEFYNREWPAAG